MNVLILTGGKSERMGRSKALIERPDGMRQIDYIVSLAKGISDQVFLSTRDLDDLGTGLPVISDEVPGGGPLAALAGAANVRLGPWLVIGCDLFLLDSDTLGFLVSHRDPDHQATVFRNRLDGKPEPLCSIYEESSMLAARSTGACARKFLESLDPLILDLPAPAALDNCNTPADLAEAFQKITHGVVLKTVRLLYFSLLKEARGLPEETVDTLACTAAGLYEELRFRHRLPLDAATLRVARNGEFAAWDAPVEECDEFVFIPPVAGG